MKLAFFTRKNKNHLSTPLSRRGMYRIAFFVCLAVWLYSPSLNQSSDIRQLWGVDITMSTLYADILFMTSFLLAICTGLLWWRENHRINSSLYHTVGVIDLSDMPRLDVASAQEGVKRALKRWFAVVLLFGVLFTLAFKFNIGAILVDNSLAMFMFIFTLMIACAGAAYIISYQPVTDVEGIMGRFANRNGMNFSLRGEAPHWASPVSGDISSVDVNWQLNGTYRQHFIEILLVTYGERCDTAYLVRVSGEGFGAIDDRAVEREKLNNTLLRYESVIENFSSTDCVIHVAATDSYYSKATISRLFATIDVVIDRP